jgi:hypothetical protein
MPTPTLAGLVAVKDHVSLISKTSLPVAKKNNPHVEGACGILTGANPLLDPSFGAGKNDWDFMTVAGPSVDELAVEAVGTTRHRSLVLAVTSLHGVNGPGTAVRYISHKAPYAFNPPEFDPKATFAKLFGARTPDPVAASVLDAVREDARELEGLLGANDRARLDRHLTAVRELELQLRDGNIGFSCTPPAEPATVASYRARAKMFARLSAMAFACDLTRVVAMEFSSPASHSEYPDIFPNGDELKVNGNVTSFHEYEHVHGINANVRKGLSYFVELYGEFVGELLAEREGNETILDHSVVLGTSELSGGNDHTFDDFPILIAGGGSGRLKKGVHVALPGQNSCRAMLTCLRAVGWSKPSFGKDQLETNQPITELLLPP